MGGRRPISVVTEDVKGNRGSSPVIEYGQMMERDRWKSKEWEQNKTCDIDIMNTLSTNQCKENDFWTHTHLRKEAPYLCSYTPIPTHKSQSSNKNKKETKANSSNCKHKDWWIQNSTILLHSTSFLPLSLQ